MLSRSQLLLLLWLETGALGVLWVRGHRRPVTPPMSPSAPAPVTVAPPSVTSESTEKEQPHDALPSLPKSCKLAFVRGDNVWTADRDGTNPHLLVRHADAPRWSWDHKQLAFARDNNIWIVNADGTNAHPLTSAWKPESGNNNNAGYGINGLTWDPLTDAVLFSHNESLTVARKGSGSVPRKDFLQREVTEVDATSLFTVASHPGVKRQPTTLLDITEQGTTFGFSHQEQPAFSRSGNYLAFARNGDIWIAKRGEQRDNKSRLEEWSAWEWDVTRLKATADYDDPNYHGSRWNVGVTGLAWSPDEKHLAYALHRLNGSGQAEIYLVQVTENDGKHSAEKPLLIADDNVNDPCFTPDGKWVAYSHIGFANATYDPGIRMTSLDGKITRKLISNAEQPAW